MNGPVLVLGTGALMPIPGAILTFELEAFEFVFPLYISMKGARVVKRAVLC